MRLELSMGQELRQELKTELQQKLELRLEQKLEQQLHLHMSLGLYLLQEDIITGFIRWANSNDGWRVHDRDGFKFTYAALPYEIAKPLADSYGPGFSHCLYNPLTGLDANSWVLFTVPELIPKGLEDFVALHERGEQLSSGNHYFASQLEFAAVGKHRKVKPYVSFIDKHYPTKFVDLTEMVYHPVLPLELVERLEAAGVREATEVKLAEEFIAENSLPLPVLRLMNKYEGITHRICSDIRDLGIRLQNSLGEQLLGYVHKEQRLVQAYVTPEVCVAQIRAAFNELVRHVAPEDVRVVPARRVNEELRLASQMLKRSFNRLTDGFLDFPEDFHAAHTALLSGKQIVNVHKSVEQISREEVELFIKGDMHSYAGAA
ncbi:MAG: hypothetical protein Q7R56_01625 [Nanoarchaeota archaeon]|nr:hypothetical protein [Nanoarchaeota archaeon]